MTTQGEGEFAVCNRRWCDATVWTGEKENLLDGRIWRYRVVGLGQSPRGTL